MPAAITDIFHIATFKNALNNKIGLGIIVNLLKVYIPKNAFVEYGLCFFIHNTNVIKEDVIAAKGLVLNVDSLFMVKPPSQPSPTGEGAEC